MSTEGDDKKNQNNGVAADEMKEEAKDVVASLHPAPTRKKVLSDISGMPHSASPVKGRRKKTISDISDMVAQKYIPAAEPGRPRRRRVKSTTDIITKFGQAPALRYDDLKYAEEIAAYGDANERTTTGSVSEADLQEMMEDEVSPFEFNFKGLTSEEAAVRLEKYGKNELPEKVTPKWLLFLSQFWAPMPIMIWIAIIIELGIQNFLE
jgi:H+-transporting ATPase